MKSRRIRLECESLESRLAPAKVVSFNAMTGALTVDGTALVDKVTISTATDGRVVVASNLGGTTKTVAYPRATIRSVVFHGYEGNDVLVNKTNVPTVAYGGKGNDSFTGGLGNDRFYGGTGNDILIGNAGNDLLYGMAGADSLNGGLGNDKLYGGTETDKLVDTSGSNTVSQTSNGVYLGYLTLSEEAVITTSITVLEREIWALTNYERERRGLSLLTYNSKLRAGAQHHARNMATYNTMAHVLPQADLKTPADRLAHYGYNWRAYAENVAWNYADAKAVMAAWMNSPGHRANILSTSVREIGVGVRAGSNGPYYCQLFGSQ